MSHNEWLTLCGLFHCSLFPQWQRETPSITALWWTGVFISGTLRAVHSVHTLWVSHVCVKPRQLEEKRKEKRLYVLQFAALKRCCSIATGSSGFRCCAALKFALNLFFFAVEVWLLVTLRRKTGTFFCLFNGSIVLCDPEITAEAVPIALWNSSHTACLITDSSQQGDEGSKPGSPGYP